MRLALALLAALTLTGCFTRLADRVTSTGWYRVTERLERVDLAQGCDLPPADGRPLVVLVHGVGGDGPEMRDAIAQLSAAPPRALFMMRWVPWDTRDAIAGRLAEGLSQLGQCAGPGELLVVAHSAGGVVSSFAASRVALPDNGSSVRLLTVASPLAGTVRRAGNPDGSQELNFMMDLGSRIARYPKAAPGVQVVHLRTSAPADHIMVPSGDLQPNDVRIGVPGAPQLDLPAHLSHDGSLSFVVAELVAGRAGPWLGAAVATRLAAK